MRCELGKGCDLSALQHKPSVAWGRGDLLPGMWQASSLEQCKKNRGGWLSYLVSLIVYWYIFFILYAAIILAPLALLAWLLPLTRPALMLGILVIFFLAFVRAQLATRRYLTEGDGFVSALSESGDELWILIRSLLYWVRTHKFLGGWGNKKRASDSRDIYLVQLCGWNFLLAVDEIPRKYTFYVNRYVRARSRQEAKLIAHASLRAELDDLLDYMNLEDDPGVTNALSVSDPVDVADPKMELPILEIRLTEDVTNTYPPLGESETEKFIALMKAGKEMIMENIVWDYDWPKVELEPATLEVLKRARSIYLSALELDRGSYGAKFSMGLITAEMNELEEACKWFDEASEILPNDPDCPRFAGIIEGLLGNSRKSIQKFEKAVQCHPLGTSFWQNLALAYRDAGKLPEARKSAERALKLDPDDPLNKRALVVIQEDESHAKQGE